MSILQEDFYQREDVVSISKELLGKYLFTRFNGKLTGGIITETEAYEGAIDKASHAYGNRRTKRTEIMFSHGGVAYVYLCYGIHHLFNVITNSHDVPHAILIRAIKPTDGIETMLKRRNKTVADKTLTGGPGTVSQALGIKTEHTGTDLTTGQKIWIEDRNFNVKNKDIVAGPRVGIDYAEEHALLPYRFRIFI